MLERLHSSVEFLRNDDVIDRVEFLKWAAATRNDNGLLIAVLDRLDEIRREGDKDHVLTRREIKPEPDRYRGKSMLQMLGLLLHDFLEDIFRCVRKQDLRDFEWGALDPVRFIRTLKYLREMESHVFNIHQAACLERTTKPRVLTRFFPNVSARDTSEIEREEKIEDDMVDWSVLNAFFSLLAVATQVIFLVFIITEVLQTLPDFFDSASVQLIVSNCIIVVATFTIFMGFVLENLSGSMKTARIIQALRVRRAEYLGERLRRDFSLFLDLIGNGLLGYILFFLNIPFVLSAETVTDAILNSLATVFLLEIDDRIQPLQPAEKFSLEMIDWDNDAAFENLVKLGHDYLYYKRDHRIPDEVEVIKVLRTMSETKDAEMQREFRPTDSCRIYVDDWDPESEKSHKVTVFRFSDDQIWPNVYEEIVYKIRGKGAKEFIQNIKSFHRIHSDDNDRKSEFTRKRVLRHLGKKKTKSVLLDISKTHKAANLRYIKRAKSADLSGDFSDDSDDDVDFKRQIPKGKKPETIEEAGEAKGDTDMEQPSQDVNAESPSTEEGKRERMEQEPEDHGEA